MIASEKRPGYVQTIRFNAEITSRLTETANRLGMTKTALVRFLVVNGLKKIDDKGRIDL